MAAKQRNGIYTITSVALGVSLLTICSWMTVPFAISFTMQTFAVFFIASVFPISKTMLILLSYIGLGLLGIPVFSGFQAGIAVFVSPTGGYLLGFFFAAFLIGGAVKYRGRNIKILIVSMTVGTVLCYLCGTIWYIFLYSSERPISFWAALCICVIPFILPDALKIALAVFLVRKTEPLFQRLHSSF